MISIVFSHFCLCSHFSWAKCEYYDSLLNSVILNSSSKHCIISGSPRKGRRYCSVRREAAAPEHGHGPWEDLVLPGSADPHQDRQRNHRNPQRGPSHQSWRQGTFSKWMKCEFLEFYISIVFRWVLPRQLCWTCWASLPSRTVWSCCRSTTMAPCTRPRFIPCSRN